MVNIILCIYINIGMLALWLLASRIQLKYNPKKNLQAS